MSSEDAVGKRIRDCRESQHLTQTQLAKILGLSSAAIWNWETQGRVPRPKTLSKVAEALHVSEEYLTEGKAAAEAKAAAGLTMRPVGPREEHVSAASQVSNSSIATEIEKIKAKVAEFTGVELSRIKLEIRIAD